MPGPARYAKAVPKLRVLRARLLGREALRELLLSGSLEDASTLLKDTPYSEITGATSPSTVQAVALRVYMERLSSIAKVLPPEARPIPEAFRREEEAKDVLAIMRSVYEGKTLPFLPTGTVPGTIAYSLRRDPEALVSFQRLLEYLQRTWFKPYAAGAARLVQEMRTGEVLQWYSTTVTMTEYSRLLERFRGQARRGLEAIVCPMLQYKAVAALANAKLLGVPVRIMDRLMGQLSTCGASWKELRTVYEREPGPAEILSSLRERYPILGIDTKLPVEQALEQSRRKALRHARRKALAAYSAYPFTPVLAGAASLLAMVEYLDVVSILTGLILRIPPDELETLLITL